MTLLLFMILKRGDKMKTYKKIFLSFVFVLLFGCAMNYPEDINPNNQAKEPAVIDVKKEVVTESEEESSELEDEEIVQEIDKELNLLIDKGKNVKSLSYIYKGPETGNHYYTFYVKGSHIKYEPDLKAIKSLDLEDSYSSIYLDKVKETSVSYCDARACKFAGKKEDLDYKEHYMITPFDWLNEISYVEKIGEEIIEKRNTLKVKADENFFLWIDAYYGVPLQVAIDNAEYQYLQMSFNNLKESEVTPQD